MGTIFTLTSAIRKTAQNAFDDLIDEFGKECRLIYPSVQGDCPNCIYDPTTNRSSGKYMSGGPRNFPFGTICPICRGKGRLDNQVSQSIKMACEWNPKNFKIVPGPIQIPNSIFQGRGYITDLPKILQSKKLIFELPIEQYMRYTFELIGEPIDPYNIVSGRYFVALWKRVGS